MDSVLLSNIEDISPSQRVALTQGRFTNVTSVLFASPQDLAKKCRIAPIEAQKILGAVCKALHKPPRPLAEVSEDGSQTITTGDESLDGMLNGGIRVGMVWDLVGEGASGKTQLALQLSLLVQLPTPSGGLSGSACYVTTHAALPTRRLIELAQEHPLASSSPHSCSLSYIQTIEAKTVAKLLLVLSTMIPSLIDSASRTSKPLKLIIIDSLADLFTDDKATTMRLTERARHLSEISAKLHTLASEHQIAIVVLNQVVDVWDRPADADRGQPGDILYADQARLFNRADTLPGEAGKSAALGLVWANQVNARIMLTRTGRRRHPDELHAPQAKRRRLDGASSPHQSSPGSANQLPGVTDQPVLIRRLTVVFSSVCPPSSIDFVVTAGGVRTVDDQVPAIPRMDHHRRASGAPQVHHASNQQQPARTAAVNVMPEVARLDVESAENELQTSSSFDASADAEDEEDAYWNEFENPIPEDLDFDAWEEGLTSSSGQ